MPIGIGAGTAIAGIVGGGAALTGAALQSHAYGSAADEQTGAANHAADLQSQSTAAALAFQKQQAEAQWVNDEANRKANYDQWAAHEANVGSIGEWLGLGGKTIQPYVPGVDPRFLDANAAPPPAGPTPAAAAARPPMGSVGSYLTPPSAPSGVNPALMGGNTGVAGNVGGLVLQPDGTYALPSSLSMLRPIGGYLGA